MSLMMREKLVDTIKKITKGREQRNLKAAKKLLPTFYYITVQANQRVRITEVGALPQDQGTHFDLNT